MSINTTKQLHPEFDSGEHKMTNREWLMSLSDEEFGIAILNADRCSFCQLSATGCAGASIILCGIALGEWLKAEHKEVSE